MNEDDIYTKAMFGQYAIRVPMWMTVQGGRADFPTSFVGSSRVHDLRYGSDKTHQLIIGEIIVRPHVVFASSHLKGHGLEGLAMSAQDILTAPDVEIVLDPMGLGVKMIRNIETRMEEYL